MALCVHSFFLSKPMLLSGRDWDRRAVPGRSGDILRDTQVRHRQGLALGMLLAVGQG